MMHGLAGSLAASAWLCAERLPRTPSVSAPACPLSHLDNIDGGSIRKPTVSSPPLLVRRIAARGAGSSCHNGRWLNNSGGSGRGL